MKRPSRDVSLNESLGRTRVGVGSSVAFPHVGNVHRRNPEEVVVRDSPSLGEAFDLAAWRPAVHAANAGSGLGLQVRANAYQLAMNATAALATVPTLKRSAQRHTWPTSDTPVTSGVSRPSATSLSRSRLASVLTVT